jgi:hypothetical protein
MGHGGLYLTAHEIELLINKFYAGGLEFLNYEEFMGLIHGAFLFLFLRYICPRTSKTHLRVYVYKHLRVFPSCNTLTKLRSALRVVTPPFSY